MKKIFDPYNHSILLNTSGSGKTRLLLQGLCHSWGFYLVVVPDESSIGSADLRGAVKELLYYSETRGEARPNTLAECTFLWVILACFLILNFLIRTAQDSICGLRPKEHRRLWVLLQVQPSRVFGEDVFAGLPGFFQDCDTKYLTERIRTENTKFRLAVQATGPLFCTVDEAQLSTRNYIFVSENDPMSKRPELSPLWKALTSVLDSVHMIVLLSGTGIHLLTIKETLASSYMKGQRYRIRSNIGAFEAPEHQAGYIKYYVPVCWTDPRWQAFLERAWVWFHGRFRITATLVLLILESGFTRPHTAVDMLVERFAGYTLTDARDWVESEHSSRFEIGYISKLDFGKMLTPSVDGDQKNWLVEVILDQVFYGSCTVGKLKSRTQQEFIRIGLGQLKPAELSPEVDMDRSKDDGCDKDDECEDDEGYECDEDDECDKDDECDEDDECNKDYKCDEGEDEVEDKPKDKDEDYNDVEMVIDKPLPILTAWQWLNNHSFKTLHNHLRQNFGHHSDVRNGFEHYIAFYLQHIFKKAPKLDNVFMFRSDFRRRSIPWHRQKFQLVTVYTNKDGARCVSVRSPSSGPSSTFGIRALSGNDILNWSSTNSDHATFCFPPKEMGPDILCFCRSMDSAKLILIAIQCRAYKKVSKGVLIHGVCSTTPSGYWRCKKSKYETAATAPFIHNDGLRLAERTGRVLVEIPNPLRIEGADYPVLCIFTSYPGNAKLERTLKQRIEQRSKQGNHSTTEAGSQNSGQNNDIGDPNKHPLATLNMKRFQKETHKLDAVA